MSSPTAKTISVRISARPMSVKTICTRSSAGLPRTASQVKKDDVSAVEDGDGEKVEHGEVALEEGEEHEEIAQCLSSPKGSRRRRSFPARRV